MSVSHELMKARDFLCDKHPGGKHRHGETFNINIELNLIKFILLSYDSRMPRVHARTNVPIPDVR